MSDDPSPFAPPAATDNVPRQRWPLRLKICTWIWCLGTFLVSLLFIVDVNVDAIFGNSIPGGFLYVVLILGPVITLVSSAVAPISLRYRVLVFFASLILMFVQLVVIGVLAFVLTGMEGIQ